MLEQPKTPRPLKITSSGIELLNTLTSDPVPTAAALDFEEIEAQLRAFELEERDRLGLVEEEKTHWVDENPQGFTSAQRAHTTMLLGGLTIAQDLFVQAALKGIGYQVEAMPVPNNESLHYGKEFGNRGQCNPTYFTVGNLVKHLIHLRDKEGLSVQEINDKYLFLTAGACGPCRFGTYVTEYRKALRDAGFEGFRVLLFQQQGGLKQATGEDSGLALTPKFFVAILQAIMVGDVLNAIGYRIRPYEVEPGATDRALDECKRIICQTFEKRGFVLGAVWRCRKILNGVKVDRLQAKPKVMIIGEFWAMTTEGDGNYKLQRFLESEGAEVDIQLTSAWILYNIWQHEIDTRRRMTLREDDDTKFGLAGTNPRKKLAQLWVANKLLRGAFQLFANTMGLSGYHLPDMYDMADEACGYYPGELRGGEGHMEVGKLIQTVKHKKAHMVISVKPFGCMPSSGVSDGVQSLVVKEYPEAIFCPIETSGDGAVNVHSRVQMFLFKARKKARAEFQSKLESRGLDLAQAKRRLRTGWRRALFYPKHIVAGTGANVLSRI